MRRVVRSLPLVLAVAAQSLHADSYVNHKVKSKEKTIRSVTLLPPSADAGREEEKAEELASEIAGIVANALRKKGWGVEDSALSSQVLQNNAKLKNLVDFLRARHETLVRQMIQRPKDVSKGRYSLGEDVANLSAPAPADVLVLVYGSSQWLYKSGGHLGGLVPSNPARTIREARTAPPIRGGKGQAKYTFLHISLVDPHTGEVLCYLQVPGAVEDRILRELRKIP